MAETEDLTQLHIADLHAKAAEAGVNGYRMLGRDELIAEIQAGGKKKRSRWPRRKAPNVDPDTKTDELTIALRISEEMRILNDGDGGGAAQADSADAVEAEAPSEPKPARRRGRRGGRGRGGSGGSGGGGGHREKLTSEQRDDAPENEETEEITGVLEITRQRHGFLSVEGSDDDVYVSASQVRRCEMKEGDEVTGPVRAPRRGERHRALVRVNLVNGDPPVDAPSPKKRGGGGAGAGSPAKDDPFDSLTPVPPVRRIELGAGAGVLVRAADLLAPLAFGQRVLVKAESRAGRTTLLRDLAQALSGAEEVELTVLLIDERPEESPAWTEAVPSADLALAPADLSPAEQLRVARTALERARKQAAEGADAVILCDSLSRLAVVAKGVDDVKRLFGSGRAFAEDEAGTLTVVATTLGDEGAALEAVSTTETSLITLDASLAAEGITPALVFGECRAVGDDKILSEDELIGLRHLRSNLSELVPLEAAGAIREKLESAGSNADVLKSLA